MLLATSLADRCANLLLDYISAKLGWRSALKVLWGVQRDLGLRCLLICLNGNTAVLSSRCCTNFANGFNRGKQEKVEEFEAEDDRRSVMC